MAFVRALWRAKWRIVVGLGVCSALYFGWCSYALSVRLHDEGVDDVGELPPARHADHYGRRGTRP